MTERAPSSVFCEGDTAPRASTGELYTPAQALAIAQRMNSAPSTIDGPSPPPASRPVSTMRLSR